MYTVKAAWIALSYDCCNLTKANTKNPDRKIETFSLKSTATAYGWLIRVWGTWEEGYLYPINHAARHDHQNDKNVRMAIGSMIIILLFQQ